MKPVADPGFPVDAAHPLGGGGRRALTWMFFGENERIGSRW